jgi:HlyD family secretion protein
MRDAGFTPGSGPPSPEVREKIRQLAAERGFELPNRGGGPERSRNSDAPVNRVVYKLVGKGETAHPEAVNVKLGISDGSQTEVIEGLAEGDLVITNVYIAGKSAAPGAPSTNPFGGGRRF